MKILDLFGIGGSFTEFYLTDYKEDVLLMGHDGPGHTRIAEGRTKVRPLDVYHGKVGRGLSVEMRVKQGPVTFYYEKRAIKRGHTNNRTRSSIDQ
jgi:L-arabinose isomerase